METANRKARRTFDKMLQVMVSDDLLKTYREAAKADGRSVASWVRHTLKRATEATRILRLIPPDTLRGRRRRE